jgi:hypothetical protein
MMHRQKRGSGSATALAIILVGLGLAVGWFGIAPAVFGAGSNPYNAMMAAEPAPQSAPTGNVAQLVAGDVVASNLQTSQPRDPFRPLILDDGTAAFGPGSGGRNGITFKVNNIEIDADGALTVEVELNGTIHTVGVGDTFAGSYKVISITPPDEAAGTLGRAVFLFGDNAFEVVEGQEILK